MFIGCSYYGLILKQNTCYRLVIFAFKIQHDNEVRLHPDISFNIYDNKMFHMLTIVQVAATCTCMYMHNV